jgi:hypothetical protein
MLDRAVLMDHLQMARRHVELGAEHIARQKAIIARLECKDRDTGLARQLLDILEETQRMHVADRQRLEKQLAANDP